MKRLLPVLLFLLFVLSVPSNAQAAPRVVAISAKKFEFAPNIITLKKDEPVTIRLTATDRAHGLLVQSLGVDLDAAPDQPAEVTITPHEAGRYDAICDHYCGAGHGAMKMTFLVE
jgi:cytochrome c oxidase subunit 2